MAFSDRHGEPLGIFARQTLPRIQELRGEGVSIWGPRRVRYDGFPTSEQLSRLERFATAEQMKALQAPGGDRRAAPRPGSGPLPFNVQGAAPLPRHLQGAGLGVQGSD